MSTTGHPMMTCGHAANGTASRWAGEVYDPPIPCCVICSCVEVAETQPDLTERIARCWQCGGHDVPSAPGSLAFFKSRPDQEHDSYYCGCRGWD